MEPNITEMEDMEAVDMADAIVPEELEELISDSEEVFEELSEEAQEELSDGKGDEE